MNNGIDFTKLNVDKENDRVRYNDELHKYWIKDSGKTCISVTTLIHEFTMFDEDFWSSYKALERLLDKDFIKIKKQLLTTKKFNIDQIKDLNICLEDFITMKSTILDEWAAKRDESCLRGTIIHKEHELGHLREETPEIKKLGLGGKFSTNTTNRIEFGSQKVYPEILLSWESDEKNEDDRIYIAGQADLIIIDGDSLYILDYKTNKSIDKKSYFDTRIGKAQMMSYPLNDLMDSNFWHYSMQLSTYAWMIKQKFPNADIKKLVLLHYDHDGNYTEYECEYLKDHVERMLAYYKQKTQHDKFKQSRKKIIF